MNTLAHQGVFLSHNVLGAEGIAALRAESGGILGIGGHPAALVAAVLGRSTGLFGTALGAELALVHRAAAASPAGRGFRTVQNLPVAVAPQLHFQLSAAGAGADAGAAACWAACC